MRTVAVVSGGRSDYSILLPILRRIQQDAELRLQLIVAGAHLSAEFGLTVNAMTADGFEVTARVEGLRSSDTPGGIAESMGRLIIGFAQCYARRRPDWLLVVGDRFEMHAAALAALPLKIPVAHLHGGELTQGVIDDALRHSITKLSHLHCVSTETYAQRVIQMGEEPWRVTVSGAPSLENVQTIRFLSRQELAQQYGLRLEQTPLLVTYHPVTLEYEQTEWQVTELLEALRLFTLPIVFTAPNADTSYRVIVRLIEAFVRTHPSAQLVENLGTRGYFSMLACAAAMVGNSSSGIVEAPSLGLPVVNIGTRQEGRVRGENVIDVGYPREEITRGIRQALDPSFRARLQTASNPYGNGRASTMIVQRLKDVPLDDRLLRKRFFDQPIPIDVERRLDRVVADVR